ncbi:hypothetical protein VW23_006390 [Devosia insulae DS-56]|uniref:DUF1127 domain-containing protein n=1 Tax=Devosia insulae DS-56 TaxID=1116389 RepID=A0A1E5XHF4_9HYPH|nr:hypothetical protein [Devosia insulae]OEO28022.1 hypothetical protein VW23_006390 [Devosia insulae DS-56]
MLQSLVNAIRSYRSSRAQRLALADLLTMPAHRRDELGISLSDVLDARDRRRHHRAECCAGAAARLPPARVAWTRQVRQCCVELVCAPVCEGNQRALALG